MGFTGVTQGGFVLGALHLRFCIAGRIPSFLKLPRSYRDFGKMSQGAG